MKLKAVSIGFETMNNYCTLKGQISSLIPIDFQLHKSFSVANSLDVNVLLPILDLPEELGLLNTGIVEVC